MSRKTMSLSFKINKIQMHIDINIDIGYDSTIWFKILKTDYLWLRLWQCFSAIFGSWDRKCRQKNKLWNPTFNKLTPKKILTRS